MQYLVDGLKCTTLTDVIGKVVTIPTEAALESELRAQLRSTVPYLGSLQKLDLGEQFADAPAYQRYPWGTWAKYSFLDLQFDVDPAIPHPEGNAVDQQWIVDLFAEMADDESGLEVLADPSFQYYVNQLKEAVAANRWYVLLFIEDTKGGPHTHDSIRERMKLCETMEIESYFPIQFKVTDAALTNTKLAWLGKHFYL